MKLNNPLPHAISICQMNPSISILKTWTQYVQSYITMHLILREILTNIKQGTGFKSPKETR